MSIRFSAFNLLRTFPRAQCRCYSSSPLLDPLVADVLHADAPKRKSKGPRLASQVDPKKAELPPIGEWRKHFQNTFATMHRVSIRNPESAATIANQFVPAGSEGKIVVESFPGPGQLTRALLALPKSRVRKLIVLEDHEPFLDYLRPLEALDPRLQVVPLGGYAWDSYQTLDELGVFSDVEHHPWETGVHPTLQFISHVPSSVIGEQLVAQLFRSIPDKQWLFQYGRVPLNFILAEHVWKRISATVDDVRVRCKVSVIAEAVAECAESLPFSTLQPFEEHFHPAKVVGPELKQKTRRMGNPYQCITVVPLENQAIIKGQLDKWDYCLRRLFVRKATPLKAAITALGPGAQVLLKKIADPKLPPPEVVDVRKLVREMSVQDWAILVKAFDTWPFAPDDLSIGDSFVMRDR